jgi:Ca2+-binding RTX toxin-like protein
MIKIKNLKPKAQQPPTAEQIYRGESGEPGASRWPAAVALTLAAVVLYLRSLFPGTQEARSAETERPPTEEAGEDKLAKHEDEDKEARTPVMTEPEKAEEAEKDTQPRPTAFMAVDSPPIDYGQLQGGRPPAIFPFEASPARASNDNPLPVRGSGFAAAGDDDAPAAGSLRGGGGTGAKPAEPPPPGPGRENPPGSGGPGAPGGPDGPTPRNRPPRLGGPVLLSDIGLCQTFMISIAALLAGASDADADPLAVTRLRSSSGELTPVEGGWLFKPAPGHAGPILLSYDVTDGLHAVAQIATFRVVEHVEIQGTAGADTLVGTTCADRIQGLGGDDNIDARAGNDVIDGGDGNDHIVAGAGNDLVLAGAGDDIVFGGTGNDVIHGGAGHDRLFGEDGDDIIHGDAGHDLILGGAGDDRLFGDEGDDEIHGETGNDLIAGGLGNDRLNGGDGNDTIDAGAGDDVVDAGTGDDVVLAGAGADEVAGGAGDDRLFGGAGADRLDGGAGRDVLKGEDGDDLIAGGAGDDILDGGAGRDVIKAGAGNDRIIVSLDGEDDEHDGEDGLDTLDFSRVDTDLTVDLVAGTAVGLQIGRDTILDIEAVIGGAGDDHFRIGAKAVSVTGGSGDDVFAFEMAGCRGRDLVHEIMDLEAGDRIVVKHYQIRTIVGEDEAPAPRPADPRFDNAYGDGDRDDRPFRFRIEKIGDEHRTYVDVYVEQGADKDFSIELHGSHKLAYA